MILFEDKEKRIYAKVTDFGLSNLTKPVSVDSTIPPIYEVIQGSSVPELEAPPEANFRHSSQSDVWSLGILLWEMFESKFKPVQHRLLHGGTLPLPQKCPNEVFSLIQQCLCIEEEKRISPEEALRQVESWPSQEL